MLVQNINLAGVCNTKSKSRKLSHTCSPKDEVSFSAKKLPEGDVLIKAKNLVKKIGREIGDDWDDADWDKFFQDMSDDLVRL